MGWLMVKKHPMVKEKGRQIDLGDIERDPICRFQRKYDLDHNTQSTKSIKVN